MARKKEEVEKARQLVENLWGFGPSDDQIRQAMDAFNKWKGGSGSYDDFQRTLWRDLKIDVKAVDKADRLAGWRANPKDSFHDRVMYLFKDGFGGGNEEWWKVNNLAHQIMEEEKKRPGGTIGPANRAGKPQDGHYIEAMKRLLKPETFTNAMIKMRAGDYLGNDAVRGTAPRWNPWRGDNPVKPAAPAAPPPGQPGAPPPGAPGGPQAPAGIDAPITLGGNQAGAGRGGGTPAPKPVDTRPIWQRQGRDPTPEEFDEYVHENFGAQAWFMDVPEVRQVIWEMAKGGLTDGTEAQRRVSQTQWFKNTSAAARTWHAHERADPATAQADIAEQTQTFKTLAGKLGIEIPEDRIRTLAEASMRFGWNTDQINKALAKEFKYDPANKVQSAKVSEIKSTAQKYLVPLADATIETWAKGLLGGEYSDEQFTEYLKGTAKSLFPQLAQAIDSGVTVEDYVNPYKQIAAQRLELPPDAINFMDTKWKTALDQIDPKTGQKRIMTLTEWEAHIKRDPTYGYDKTQQGVGEAAKLANDLLQKFGQVA